MPFEFVDAAPGSTIPTLASAIAGLKGNDPLAPVTVVVPTNVSGVMARRALGREQGVLGVDMLTLNRLAEVLGGPALAAEQRQPVSSPVLNLAVRAVLDREPGVFHRIAGHPSTVSALREAHEELRIAGPNALAVLEADERGREVARVSREVAALLSSRWYDEADLLNEATRRIAAEQRPSLGHIVLHLPGDLRGLPLTFVRTLGARTSVTVVSCLTGDKGADAAPTATASSLRSSSDLIIESATSGGDVVLPAEIVSTTDADEEVAAAVRVVVDSARGATTGRPVALERIAILWPTHEPYARLVEHHLTAADIAWNGRGGTELTERLAPRLLLDLLDVDRRGLRRRELFELLADIPPHGADGSPHPTAAWERVSRLAGVSEDRDWEPRLTSLARHERWADTAQSLSEFVRELRATLGRRDCERSWSDWVDWSAERIDAWLGAGAIARMSDPEYRAWEALMAALERLRCLDELGDSVTRPRFRSVLEAELDARGVRDGRIGTGVTIGSLASAGGLDVDVAIVLGAADGLLPPTPRRDPLLSDTLRQRAGLAPPDERARRFHHEFRSVVDGVHTVVTMPRGDLRTTTEHQPSRWLGDVTTPGGVDATNGAPADNRPAAPVHTIASFADGLARTAFAATSRERRLTDLLRINRSGTAPSFADAAAGVDPLLDARLPMLAARARPRLTPFDGDLSAVTPPSPLAQVVSPTQIESWATCPYAYFVTYVLGVRPVDDPDSEIIISPANSGVVQHDAVDRLHRDVIAGRLPQPTATGWTDVHREALLSHFDAACERAESLGRTGRPATWAGARARMRSDLLEWLDRDGEWSRSRHVTVLASEYRFGSPATPDREPELPVTMDLPDGRKLAVRGSIDRLDRSADGTLVVTDHKTGKAKDLRRISAEDPTLGGTKFQLATYAAAAIARERLARDSADRSEPPLVRSEYSMFALGRYERIGFETTADVWATIADDVGTVVDGIEAGWFPQRPERPGFRLWVPCLFCEPDGLGTTETWQRWSSKRSDPRLERWFDDDVPEAGSSDHDGEQAR